MIACITGGKGGTGKSTIATALAIELAKNNKVLLMDVDVDCPNDHIILDIHTKKIKDIETMIPVFTEKCTRCGTCSQVCKENAIVQVKDKLPILVKEQCTGCKACMLACPVNAIDEAHQVIGSIKKGTKDNITLITGETRPGVEESSLVVNAVKKQTDYSNYDHIIIDTAAGTHCPVIAALTNTDIGIAVTEPTPLGNHDLHLILELMKKLQIKSKVIINRSDISSTQALEKTVKNHKTEIIAKIPYSKTIIKQYCKGQPIQHPAIKKLTRLFA